MKKLLVVLCLVVLTVGACSSSKEESSRKRRADVKKTSTTKEKENTTTAPTVAPSDTKAVVEKPLLSAEQIKSQWTKEKLCGLITGKQAEQVLGMTTVPTSNYQYAEQLGANCRWNKGDGDAASIEISTQGFADARNIDASLNAHGQAIVVSGVAGVIKTNGLGTFIELNIWGEKSNQWTANAPTQEAAKKLAEFLIASLA